MNDREQRIKAGMELAHRLADFHGSAAYYRGWLPTIHYTDGVKCFMDSAGMGARWLFDILATEKRVLNNVRRDGFAVVKLQVYENQAATLIVDDGGRGGQTTRYYDRHITFTDCPPAPGVPEDDTYWQGQWKFYLEMGELEGRSTIIWMLPGER